MDWDKLKKGQSINLVLSGGGTKGVVHVAVLEKLESLGVEINAISGTSAGAMVACMYSSGKTTADIYRFFEKTKLINYSRIKLTRPGIFDSSRYRKTLQDELPENFEDLNFPVHVAATNLGTGKADYFYKGPLVDPILASCAVPAIFSPVRVQGYLYADGGISDNFPITPFVNDSRPIIGSYVNSTKYRSIKELQSIRSVSRYAAELLLFNANAYKFDQTLFTVQFPLSEFGFLDSKVVPKVFNKAKRLLA